MAEIGMDVEAVRAVAVNIDTQAHSLSSIISSIDGLVGRLHSAWIGHDAQEFANWWNSQHKPALVKVQASVAGLAQSAKNNATEQDHASAASGTNVQPVTHSPVVGSGTNSGGSAAVGAAAAATQAQRQSALANFTAAYPVGVTVGPGNSNGECVGLFEEYSMNYVHTPEFFTSPFDGAAYDFYTHYNDIPGLSAAYTQIPAGSTPQPGDVVVFASNSPDSGGNGHIAIVTTASGSSFDVLEQNAAIRHAVSPGKYSDSNPYILGYLRPNQLS